VFLAVPGVEGHGKPGLLPGKHVFDVLVRVRLVDQPGTVGIQISPQKGGCRSHPVRQNQPRRTGPAPISAGGGAGGGAIGEQDVGKQGFGKRILRKLIVSNQGLGERVLRKNVVGVHEVEVIVIGKPVRNRGSMQNAGAVRRSCCQCQIPEAFHGHSLPRGSDKKGRSHAG